MFKLAFHLSMSINDAAYKEHAITCSQPYIKVCINMMQCISRPFY